jgi:hypothetical protein
MRHHFKRMDSNECTLQNRRLCERANPNDFTPTGSLRGISRVEWLCPFPKGHIFSPQVTKSVWRPGVLGFAILNP